MKFFGKGKTVKFTNKNLILILNFNLDKIS